MNRSRRSLVESHLMQSFLHHARRLLRSLDERLEGALLQREQDFLRRWHQQLRETSCPITGRPFFMLIQHPSGEWLPTYGGPYSSYTVPHRARPFDPSDRELVCERYDHDLGEWIDGLEAVPEIVVDSDEYYARRHDADEVTHDA